MSFKSIRGQKAALEPLVRRVASGSVPHAQLFTGPAGVGKFASAVEFAKALFCDKKSGDACGACRHCLKIASGSHPDLHIVRPNDKSNILIADIRAVMSRAQFKPFEASAQVVILDEAQCMGPDAQNALLKILEEPPANVFFVLISSEPHLLFPTVLSRCQRSAFESLSDDDVAAILVEKKGLEGPDARRLGRLGRGSVAQALALEDVDFKASEERAFECVAAAKTGAEVRANAGKPVKKETLFELDCLADVYRDLLVLKAAPERGGLLHADRSGELEAAASKYDIEEIERILETIGEMREGVDQNLNLKLMYMKLWEEMGLKAPV